MSSDRIGPPAYAPIGDFADLHPQLLATVTNGLAKDGDIWECRVCATPTTSVAIVTYDGAWGHQVDPHCKAHFPQGQRELWTKGWPGPSTPTRAARQRREHEQRLAELWRCWHSTLGMLEAIREHMPVGPDGFALAALLEGGAPATTGLLAEVLAEAGLSEPDAGKSFERGYQVAYLTRTEEESGRLGPEVWREDPETFMQRLLEQRMAEHPSIGRARSYAAKWLAEFHAHPNALEENTNTQALRRVLHQEEHDELMVELEKAAASEGDLGQIARELADVVYVAYGSAWAFGIDLDAALSEIHRAAMTKMRAGLRREDGKILKPPGFVPPDMSAAVADARLETGHV